MPYIQRNEVGSIVGRYANAQPGFAEEWLSDDSLELFQLSPEQLAVNERLWRNDELLELIWLRDRHRDQLEIGATTTLSAAQFNELLLYMQALRDWPQSALFPDSSQRPQPPQFLEQFGGEQ